MKWLQSEVMVIIILIIIIVKKQPRLSFFHLFEDTISPETSGPAENITSATVISPTHLI